MTDIHPMPPKFSGTFRWFLLAYALFILSLWQEGSETFEKMHLMLDTGIGIMSLFLALFLLGEQHNITRTMRQYLVIAFGLAAFAEIVHALVGIEWNGALEWIESSSQTIRPATWPPSTYVLPLALAYLWGNERTKRALRPIVFAAVMAIVLIGLFALAWALPKYVDTGILGIQRPTQIPLLFLWVIVISMYWRDRVRHPLYEGLAWMGAMLLISDLCMLYSTAPHEKFAMMAHAGKLLAYMLFHVVQMQVAAEDSAARAVAESALLQGRDRLDKLLSTSPVVIYACSTTPPYGATYISPNCEKITGYEPQQFLTNSDFWLERIHPDDRQRVLDNLHHLFEHGTHHEEYRFRTNDGIDHWMGDDTRLLLNEAGEPAEIIGAWGDITNRKQAEEYLQLATAIYQSSSEAIMVTDEDNLIVDVNPAFTHITGYDLGEIAGKDPRIFQSGRHGQEFYRAMWEAILTKGHWQGELWDRRKDGDIFAKWVNISVLRHADGTVYRHVEQFSDITEKKQTDDLILAQANFDPLTSLPNRRLFQDQLAKAIENARRTRLTLTLFLIDLDHFKDINDTLGHAKGDELLQEAARRISAWVRKTDSVARLGGDEFAVILPELGDKSRTETIAMNIIQELNKPFHLQDNEIGLFISASIGITVYPEDGTEIDSMMKHVDQALYKAKAEGRGRFSYFTAAMGQEVREKLELTHELRQALACDELRVFYQPIVELASGRTVKAEALLRWKHAQRGMVSPATFIPLAEQSGLIIEIGTRVFESAVADIAQWRKQLGCLIQVSVNTSPLEFEQSAERSWSGILTTLGLPGNSITVEITEGMLLKQSPRVRERLLEFSNTGIEVCIDDFGTGFSSLSYLKQFDIDYLKIDRSFIKNLNTDEADRALSEAIIVMAHKLGIKTIAEGVETSEQRDLLIEFGCDYAQGFLYSPAVPAAEFANLLDQQRV